MTVTPETVATPLRVDVESTRRALRAAAGRSADLVAGMTDVSRPVPGMAWTVGQTAAHMVFGLRVYRDSLLGEMERWGGVIPAASGYRERMAAVTSHSLALETGPSPASVSATLREAANAFLQASEGRSPDEPVPTPWYGEGIRLPLGVATSLLLGEQVMHAYDIQRGLGLPARIDAGDARLIVPAMFHMMPVIVDVDAARKVRAVFRMHVRGGPTMGVRIRNGHVDVAPWGTWRPRADCKLSGDVVGFTLLAYGRMGQWPLIARGKIVAFGRRPWLGLKLRGLFHNP